jgi:hypothetical protein
MIDKGDAKKRANPLRKILGGDSRLQKLTNLRKIFVDDLVLNKRESSNEKNKKERPKER